MSNPQSPVTVADIRAYIKDMAAAIKAQRKALQAIEALVASSDTTLGDILVADSALAETARSAWETSGRLEKIIRDRQA